MKGDSAVFVFLLSSSKSEIACSRLSVSGADRKKRERNERRAGSGKEEGSPHFSLPDPAIKITFFPKCGIVFEKDLKV